jgi:hypothetical protein
MHLLAGHVRDQALRQASQELLLRGPKLGHLGRERGRHLEPEVLRRVTVEPAPRVDQARGDRVAIEAVVSRALQRVIPTVRRVLVTDGGMGRLHGAVIGAFAYVLLQEWLSAQALFGTYAKHWQLAMGGLIVIMVLVLPHGLGGLLDMRAPRAREDTR